jgi:photosystem II oxygen-evolving enhancer protein 3
MSTTQVLSGFLAGAALTISGAANAAATPVDLFDDRKVISKGFLNIYEARDSTLPENQRQGRTQARTDIASTRAHAKASEARIDSALEPSIKKNYWCEGQSHCHVPSLCNLQGYAMGWD